VTVPDYFDVTWSPTRGLAIVRSTCDEIPWAECDEAAHQLLAAGNMARRINTPGGDAEPEPEECVRCGHTRRHHAGDGEGPCGGRFDVPCAAACPSFAVREHD
jgi:hypothetical protein